MKMQGGLRLMREAHELYGGGLLVKPKQGLMSTSKAHVRFGLWPPMNMQRGL